MRRRQKFAQAVHVAGASQAGVTQVSPRCGGIPNEKHRILRSVEEAAEGKGTAVVCAAGSRKSSRTQCAA